MMQEKEFRTYLQTLMPPIKSPVGKIYSNGMQYIIQCKDNFQHVAISEGELIQKRASISPVCDKDYYELPLADLPGWVKLLADQSDEYSRLCALEVSTLTLDVERIDDFIQATLQKVFGVLTDGKNLEERCFASGWAYPQDFTDAEVNKMYAIVKSTAERVIRQEIVDDSSVLKYIDMLKVFFDTGKLSRIRDKSNFIKAALTAQEFSNNPFPDLDLLSVTSSNLKKISF